MKSIVYSFFILAFVSCNSNDSVGKADSDSPTDSTAQKDGGMNWDKWDADSTSNGISFYKVGRRMIMQLPNKFHLEKSAGVDFSIQRCCSPNDTFYFYLGFAPNLPQPLHEFVYDKFDSPYRQTKLDEMKKHQGHYVEQIEVIDSVDKKSKVYRSQWMLEIVDNKTHLIWIKRPINYGHGPIDIAVKFNEKEISTIPHIMGTYEDSIHYNSMLTFARNIEVK